MATLYKVKAQVHGKMVQVGSVRTPLDAVKVATNYVRASISKNGRIVLANAERSEYRNNPMAGVDIILGNERLHVAEAARKYGLTV